MPRTARSFIENACYHIVTRGNQRQNIFKEQEDFIYYTGLIHKYKLKIPVKPLMPVVLPIHWTPPVVLGPVFIIPPPILSVHFFGGRS